MPIGMMNRLMPKSPVSRNDTRFDRGTHGRFGIQGR